MIFLNNLTARQGRFPTGLKPMSRSDSCFGRWISTLRQSKRRVTPMPFLAVCLIACISGVGSTGNAADPYEDVRHKLVEKYIASAGITNQRVLEAMRSTPRHEFLKLTQRQQAYFDMAIPIGHGQTISPPYIVAFMTAQLDPRAEDRVLEIGTGSGYQAAVLSPLAKEVYTIEIVEPLGEQAAKTLQKLGYKNVFTKIGDGYKGWSEHAPFDKIIVTCSPEKIPQPLIDQLAEGGQIIIPIGERFQQTLCRFRKTKGQLKRETLQETFFVPMTGKSEELREIKPDQKSVQLAHGSFEETIDNSKEPAGWYYVREAEVTPDDDARDGQHVLRMQNSVPGRNAHVLQAFGVDGLLVRQIELRLWAKGSNLRFGPQRGDRAGAIIEFYGENRAPVGHANLGPWKGNFKWTEKAKVIRVPPQARLGVVGVGLFGSTGTLDVDQVTVKAR